jgi:hypothetical protein
MTSSTTNIWILQIRRILRNPSVRQTGLVGPLIGVLRLPGPLDPPVGLFVRNHLRLPVLPQERLVRAAETRGGARETVAGADVGAAGVTAVIAGTNAASVQVLGAVRLGWCPFTDDEPEIESGERRGHVACRGDVLRIAVGYLLFVFVIDHTLQKASEMMHLREIKKGKRKKKKWFVESEAKILTESENIW